MLSEVKLDAVIITTKNCGHDHYTILAMEAADHHLPKGLEIRIIITECTGFTLEARNLVRVYDLQENEKTYGIPT